MQINIIKKQRTANTGLEIFMGGGNTKAISGHSDDQVIERNYLDKREIAKASKAFRVFSKEAERTTELKEIRNEIMETKQKEREV